MEKKRDAYLLKPSRIYDWAVASGVEVTVNCNNYIIKGILKSVHKFELVIFSEGELFLISRHAIKKCTFSKKPELEEVPLNASKGNDFFIPGNIYNMLISSETSVNIYVNNTVYEDATLIALDKYELTIKCNGNIELISKAGIEYLKAASM
ncbi:MAG: hypothetical protein COB67_00195 [SAR324 cluster bacterium]|uniref:Uncharacterized protein n=1 Tax=SAR324 cluster bacterium TaxID=2024889 RepID=A0A2A4TC70_9DELT|nr:MAG: hypothetical protein COB67_00195 [SAR324 cluster bacterium]